MKTFPKLDDYSVDELILIVYHEAGDWQEEAADYAKYLLMKKGVTETFAKKRVLELEKETYKVWETEIENRKTESYTIIDLIFMTILWPKYLLRDWYLKRNGYILKRKQRLISISLGFLICFLALSYEMLTNPRRQQEKLDKLTKVELIDSITKSKIDWSGEYIFIDTLKCTKGRITWKLLLKKRNNKHIGTLILNNGNENVSIPCIGLIKDRGLEIYPDTNATLLNRIDVGYYDNLFILCKRGTEIMTIWEKVKPYYNLKNNETGIFKKTKAAKMPGSLAG